jgi:hypothetical protein
MSPYRELLRLAEAQSAAVQRGDVEAAIGLLDARGALLAQAATPGVDDLDAIREVLRLDRELSGAIRERMLAIHAEATGTQRGQHALRGYGRCLVDPSAGVDSRR